MNLVENIRVCQKRAQTGFRTKINGPATIFNARKISGICIPEFPSAERDKTGKLFGLLGSRYHAVLSLVHFGDKDLKWIDRQASR